MTTLDEEIYRLFKELETCGALKHLTIIGSVEFLWPRVGPKTNSPQSIPQLGVKARPLRFMWLLVHYPIESQFKEIPITLPHPAAYGVHKLIISTRRTKKPKRENDREQAEMVLTTLSKSKDIELLQAILSQLSKKEKRAVHEAIRGRPLLEELFDKLEFS